MFEFCRDGLFISSIHPDNRAIFVRVCASVRRILTAIASDAKCLFSEGFAQFHVVMGRRAGAGGGDLCSSAVTSAVFTCLRSQFPSVVSGTISGGGRQGGGEAPGTAVSRAQLGFHDWEAASDYARAG